MMSVYGVCLCSVLLHDVCIGFVAVVHTSHGVYAIYLHGLAHAYQLYTRTTAIQHVCTHAHNHTYNHINLSLHPSSAPTPTTTNSHSSLQTHTPVSHLHPHDHPAATEPPNQPTSQQITQYVDKPSRYRRPADHSYSPSFDKPISRDNITPRIHLNT